MRYDRLVGSRLTRLASYFPLVAVSGACQAGKTTLLRECFDRYNYVCLDLPSKAGQAERNPAEFLNENPPPLLVDEARYAPALLRHLKLRVDAARQEMGRYVIAGSQHFTLMKGVAESLAGRIGLPALGAVLPGHDAARKAGISAPADRVIVDYALVREPVMNRIAWQERVVIEEHIHHGDPCIKGTRIPVKAIIGSLADGMSGDEIRREYPQLTDEDIRAALAYAAELIDSEVLAPLNP